MAEAENTDVGDPYLQNLKIRPARHIQREAGVDGSGEDRRKRGFNKLFVVVTEAVFGSTVMRGSGVLCPSVDDWPEFGEEVDEFQSGYEYQWILTAGHCVCVQKRSASKLPDRMRIRIPKYGEWPSKKLKNFQPGPMEALETGRFVDIMYTSDDIKKFVHVYDLYKNSFASKGGQDFSLIQIPVYKSTLAPNTFQVWNTNYKPDGFSIVGFPWEDDKAYLPYFDRRKEFSVFESSSQDPELTQIYYKSDTSGGQSGGPVQFINLEDNYRAVVGVHVTGKSWEDDEASGCMITEKISKWIGGLQKESSPFEQKVADAGTPSEKRTPTRKKEGPQNYIKIVEEEEGLAKKKIEFDFEKIAGRDAIQTLEGHTDVVRTICLDAEEKFSFSGGDDNKIIMWNMRNYEKMKTFDGHTGAVYCVTVLRDGFLLSGGGDKVLKKWNIESGRCVGTMKTDGNCFSISMTSDERIAAIGNGYRKTLLTDIETMKVNQKFDGWQPTITRDNKYIIAATNLGKDITIYQMEDASAVKTIRYGSQIWCLAVTKDASVVVTGSTGGEIVMWRVANSTRIHTMADAHSKHIMGLRFTRNEEYVVSASIDKTIKMRRTQDAQCVVKLEGVDPYYGLILNKDNTRCFTGTAKNTIKIWYLRDEEE